MEVKMNKEIRDYQESMFMGLDLRQCVCSVLAILTAIGIYFGMRDITGQEITGWLCVIGAAPQKDVPALRFLCRRCCQEGFCRIPSRNNARYFL